MTFVLHPYTHGNSRKMDARKTVKANEASDGHSGKMNKGAHKKNGIKDGSQEG